MKKLFVMMMAVIMATMILTGCGSVTKVTHMVYDENGHAVMVTDVTETDSDGNVTKEYTIIEKGQNFFNED